MERVRFMLMSILLSTSMTAAAATVATPTLSPAPGKFSNNVSVTIRTTTSGAQIRYTLDGTDPTSSSRLYSSPVKLSSSTTLRARAFKSGMTMSARAGGDYAMFVATPAFSTAGALFVGSIDVRPSCATSDAVIRYTTDGSTPTENSTRYWGFLDFTFREQTTLKLRAFRGGFTASNVATATYTPAVLVLLHGLNSDVSTWGTFVMAEMSRRGEYCPTLSLSGSVPKATCYRYNFKSRPVGGTSWSNGDGATYSELGDEVRMLLDQVAKTRPAFVVLVGHSRGGLAARAYMQALSSTPSYKLALLTIGTPHQGSPLGRIKWWLDDNGKTYSWVQKPFKFLYSPSTGYLATWHTSASPVRRPAIWDLNAGAGKLGSRGVAFGEIISTGLRLGENAWLNLNVFDGSNLGSFLPGELEKLKEYVHRDLPSSWATDGDGIVPTASQKLTALPGFTKSSSTSRSSLSRVPHIDETAKAATIMKMLEGMIAGKSATSILEVAMTVQDEAEFNDLSVAYEAEFRRSLGDLHSFSSRDVARELAAALDRSDAARFAAAEEILTERGRNGDRSVVPALHEVLSGPVGPEVVTILGRIATPESVQLLVDTVCLPRPNGVVREAGARVLSTIGTWVSRENVDDVDLVIRGSFMKATDALAVEAVSLAMADLGTEIGAGFLWARAAQGEDSAVRALRGPARSDAVVDVLASALLSDVRVRHETSVIAGETLATIVSPRATRALLILASAGSPEGAAHAIRWLENASDTESLAMMERAAESSEIDPAIRARLRVLAERKRDETTPRISQ